MIRTNRSGPGDGSARALRRILENNDDLRAGQGNYLGYAALTLFQYPDAEKLLRRVLDRNPNHNDQGAACYWLARHLSYQARMVRRLRKTPADQKVYEKYVAAEPIAKLVKERDPDALDKASEALLERAIHDFGRVLLAGDTRQISEFAPGELFALRDLAIGKPAPEIEGLDHEGKPFKLSETRGKVVLLTFSGNWCGPCVGMYPQDRALVAKHKGKSFALVSVNTDKEIDTLKKSIATGDITWRCWWDKGTDGPITTHWGITGFPTIFVLDGNGVICFKDVRDDELDRAVASLLDSARPSQPPTP